MIKEMISDISGYRSEDIYRSAYEALPDSVKERVDRMRMYDDKVRSVAAWSLLREGLKDIGVTMAEGRIGYGEYGKPMFMSGETGNEEIFFNLSHSEERVMCVIAERPVGCDVQIIGGSERDIAKRFFHPNEYEVIRAIENEEEAARVFARLWTIKESFIKAVGRGLSCAMDSFWVDISQAEVVIRPTESLEFKCQDFKVKEIFRNDRYCYSYVYL